MMDKAFRQIIERLDRIEAKLDQVLAGQIPATLEETGDTALPWAGYDEMTVEQTVERLRGMDETDRSRALAYERANRNRKGIVSPAVNWNSRAEP